MIEYHTVRAMVTVEVSMEIKATSQDEAERIFDESLSMDASLVDVDDDDFIPDESSIAEIDIR